MRCTMDRAGALRPRCAGLRPCPRRVEPGAAPDVEAHVRLLVYGQARGPRSRPLLRHRRPGAARVGHGRPERRGGGRGLLEAAAGDRCRPRGPALEALLQEHQVTMHPWVEGDALALPFADCSFDAVMVGYGLRNVVDRPKVMAEIFRVLKPGSRASILDISKRSSQIIENPVIDNLVAIFAVGYGLVDEYKYLKRSISQYLTGEELEELAIDAGFASARHYDVAGGLMANLVATRSSWL